MRVQRVPVRLCLVIVQNIQFGYPALALVNTDGQAVQRPVCALALGRQRGLVFVYRSAAQQTGQLVKLSRHDFPVIRQAAHLGQLLPALLPGKVTRKCVYVGQQLENAFVNNGGDHALIFALLARHIIDGILGRVAVVLSDRTAAGLRPLLAQRLA